MNWKNKICNPFHLIDDSCVRTCLLLSTFSCTCLRCFDALIFYRKSSNAQTIFDLFNRDTSARYKSQDNWQENKNKPKKTVK